MLGFDSLCLRTTDPAGARAFYAPLVGDAWEAETLPAGARARGAVPHWLGALGVADVPTTLAAFVAEGAQPLGPASAERAILRGPGDAILALRRGPADVRPGVAQVVLNVRDPDRAQARLEALCGWRFAPLDPSGTGPRARIEWASPFPGFLSSVADTPEVHPHVLFFFRVDDLVAAVAGVRQGGGRVVFARPDSPTGPFAVAEDPQGAAFGLTSALPG